MAATAQRKDITDKLEHHLCRLHIRIRPVVFRAESLLPRHEYAWEIFLGHYNPWIRLVVFQQHIIAGLILFDHRALQMESVLLRMHHYEAHVYYGAHQQIGATDVVLAIEIRRYSPLKALCLPDVDHRARIVELHVYPRRLRKRQYLLAEFLPGTVVTYIVRCAVRFYLKIEAAVLVDVASGSCQEIIGSLDLIHIIILLLQNLQFKKSPD